ncbi:PEP-CTERM sorting domain-containing protein [Sphingomonas daechungensis]|uniref:PEP-CTERM sorting domain-containing protein n=2 Tax=Sphingomonas daechungensis TaxID=1176646 RepID=A0ABX6T9W3_9SPHN|nr:PEP-CTERM sorting domain-containing protein [Sphingomonas daechungensis]
MFPDGTLRIVTIPPAGAPTFNVIAGGTTIAGNSLSATVPLSLLDSMGLAPEDYMFNLWSRTRVNPLADGTNAEIADFLSSSTQARAVPEPATWLMMLLGFGLTGTAFRRSRRASLLKAVA